MKALKGGVSVVIPCYNSSLTIEELVKRIRAVLEGMSVGHEIILVNDGSMDGTWEKIRELAAADSRVRGINLMRNYGQHNALLCGIRKAERELILTLDDDLQHPPEEIPKLFGRLDENTDVVYGCAKEQVHGFFRNLASRMIKGILAMIMGVSIAGRVSPFRLFRTLVRDAFENYDSPNVSVDVLLSWGTRRFSSVQVGHEERKSGRSNYSFMKLVSYAFDMITGFSVFPLKVTSIVGFLFTIFGFIILLYVLIRYVTESGRVPGFPFLASIISLFAGVQLFALGIIGEYLARMHFKSMRHPAFTVREETGGEGRMTELSREKENA